MEYGALDHPDDAFAKRVSYLLDSSGVIYRSYPRVKPEEHPAEVLADLRKLLAEEE